MNNKTVGLKELNRKNLYTLSPGIKKEINQFFRENNRRITTIMSG